MTRDMCDIPTQLHAEFMRARNDLVVDSIWASSMSMLALPNELVHRIIDLLSGDVHALREWSLVSKLWLLLVRHRCFNDIIIRRCYGGPSRGSARCWRSRCKGCITQFALLAKSNLVTIPRSARTLELRAGGLENSRTLKSATSHFHTVQHLKIEKVVWPCPSWRTSPNATHFLSTIKSLTLDNVYFVAGIGGLLWMLEKAVDLRTLTIGKIVWSDRHGMLDGRIPRFPYLSIPFYYLSDVSLKVKDRTRRSKKSYKFLHALHELDVTMSYSDADDPVFIFLLNRKNVLRTVTTAVITTLCISRQSEVQLCESLLDAMESLHHLSIHTDVHFKRCLTPPTLMNLTTLESLSIHISTLLTLPVRVNWMPWFLNILQTASSPKLRIIRLVVKSYKYDPYISLSMAPEDVPGVDTVDHYVSGLSNIDQFRVSFVKIGEKRKESAELAVGNWLRAAFRRCDASGVLVVNDYDI